MTFYEKVLTEFIESKEIYICHGSETFVKAWEVKYKRLKITSIAKKFLKVFDKMHYAINFKPDFDNGLFDQICIDEEDRQLRIDFLNWCIQNNLDL